MAFPIRSVSLKALLSLIGVCSIARPGLAEGGATLSASPAVVILRGQVGQSTTQTLTVSNGTGQTMAFDMVAKDVVVRNGRRVSINAGEVPGSYAATAVFSKKNVAVPPGGSAQVNVTVTVPQRPSGRAMVAYFQGTTKIPSGPVAATASLGILFVFTLSDDVAMQASPLLIQPPTRSSNLTASQECTNSGHEPFVAKGILAIVDRSGRVVGKAALLDHRLLPAERMSVRIDYGGELPAGRYRGILTYDLGTKSLTSTAEFNVR